MIYAGLILIILGALIHYGKCYNLIAGYNTLPKEKKDRITKDQLNILSRAMRNMSWGMGFSILAVHFAFDFFNINFPHYVPIIIFGWAIPYIIYMRMKIKID